MARPVAEAGAPQQSVKRKGPAGHLMCGVPFWGAAVFIACVYFAYSVYGQLRNENVYFQHGTWTLVTWGIWIALLAGLASETRCWRERIFFAVLLANFALGFVLAAWGGAPIATVRVGREISLGLWVLAALASLRTARTLPPANSGTKE